MTAPEGQESEVHCMRITAEPNSGNGASFQHYSWTQTLAEVSLVIPVPKGTKGKELDVKITRTTLKVATPSSVVHSVLLKSLLPHVSFTFSQNHV